MDEAGMRKIIVSRRGFLVGSAGLALTIAGCGGGGGDSSSGELFNGTYRASDTRNNIAASVTVDQNGRVTFWTLLAQQNPFADFGQTRMDDNRFSTTVNGVRTSAELRNGTFFGRTEDTADTSAGFDWFADEVGFPPQSSPPDEFQDTFSGSARIRGIDVVVLLGVSPDGNATFFGAFNDPANDTNGVDVDFYAFEGLSINRSGIGYGYFLDLYGDRIDLRDAGNGDIRLLYTFGTNAGEFQGETFEVPLGLTRAQSPARSARIPVNAPGLRRAVAAFQAKKARGQ